MERMLLWENAPGMCEEIPTLEYYPAKEKKKEDRCRHGLGLATAEAPHVAQWANLLQNWLVYIGWL